MAQNIYDTADFFTGYSQLPRSVHGLDGAPEWPAIRAILPKMHGRRVVDLGCGFGWFSRWARANGAEAVLGLDISENMLTRARAETSDTAIQYAVADLDRLELPTAAFDLAYSSLALHYIVDFRKLTETVHAALTPGSHFVFSIEHPVFMAPTRPGWVEHDGRSIWPVDAYHHEGPRTTDWLAPNVIKQHRTMATTLNTLIASGFALRHIEEWRPSAQQIAAHPDWASELDRPTFLIVSAQR